MTETVRFVADGEELVLSANEAFRIHSTPEPPALPLPKVVPAVPRRLAIQYLGFKEGEGRREYALSAQRGDESRRYTVWIAQAAFSERRALLQEGPDICYQKLSRLLAGAEPIDSDCIAVTEGDLADYRVTHTAPVRRSFSALPAPAPAPQPEAPPTTDESAGRA